MSDDIFKIFESYALHEKAMAIEAHELNPQSNPELMSKPVSMRLPLYKIAALEAVAVKMSLTRQDLMMKLIESSLGSAISGYATGWHENQDDSGVIQGSIDFVSEIDSLSSFSKNYLAELVFDFHGIHFPQEEDQ